MFLFIKQNIMLVTYAVLTHWTLKPAYKKNDFIIYTWQSLEIGRLTASVGIEHNKNRPEDCELSFPKFVCILNRVAWFRWYHPV